MKEDLVYIEEDGIHKFTWKSANRRSVDAWLNWMTQIRVCANQPDYILLDFSEIGLPPVRYLAMQVRRWMSRHRASQQGTTIAIVYSPNNMPFLIVARSYTATLRRGRQTKLEFFPSDNMDAAYEWLHGHIKNNAKMG